jgi:hypothetical protein
MLIAASVVASEKAIRKQDLPPAVQKAVEAATTGAEIKGYAKETENGKVTYEVETRVAGRARDVSFDPDGTLAVVEEEVALASIPAAAKAGIEKGAAGGHIGLVEKVTERGAVKYEAHVSHGARKSEVVVTPDGSAPR